MLGCVQDGSPATFPWPAGSATGIGSMPGTDPAEAMAVVLGELPDLPHLPELPARGPGADLVGRTAALLIDLPVQVTASGWRLTSRPGRDLRRARSMLSADLDAMEEAAEGYAGAFKIQVCGPWTLAASVERGVSVEPALADHGAVADLITSLSEGVAAHVAEVRRRLPGAALLLQVDEPSLPAVLAGAVPSASGLRRVAAVEEATVTGALRDLLAAAGTPAVVHCCAAGVPLSCVTGAGAAAVSLDLSLLGRAEEDSLGEAAEAGLGILAGVLPVTEPSPGSGRAGPRAAAVWNGGARLDEAQRAARDVVDLWRRLGLPPGRLREQVVPTPACGLAGVSPAGARLLLGRCREAARLIGEIIEEDAR